MSSSVHVSVILVIFETKVLYGIISPTRRPGDGILCFVFCFYYYKADVPSPFDSHSESYVDGSDDNNKFYKYCNLKHPHNK